MAHGQEAFGGGHARRHIRQNTFTGTHPSENLEADAIVVITSGAVGVNPASTDAAKDSSLTVGQ